MLLLVNGASAGGAWYLLVPPATYAEGKGRTATEVPLGQWQQFAAFNSVQECERERLRWLVWVNEQINELFKSAKEKKTHEGAVNFLATFLNGRGSMVCVASDDIRLR